MYSVYATNRLPRRKRLASLLVPLLLVLLTAGCSSKGTVSGKVTYNGKPLTVGMVTFLPESGQGGAFTSGIKEDGSYTVSGVPKGKVKILVISSPTGKIENRGGQRMSMMAQAVKSKKMEISEEAKKNMPAETKKALEESDSAKEQPTNIPRHYGDLEKSGLELTVTGGSQTHDIELK